MPFRIFALVASFCVFGLNFPAFGQAELKTVHVFVALCDNKYQGIVPVPARIGNGDDPSNNLYWGCGDGVKSYFKNSREWVFVASPPAPGGHILERCVFKHKTSNAFLVADAYRGAEIKRATADFLDALAGDGASNLRVEVDRTPVILPIGGGAAVVAYVGHNGLMDFQLPPSPKRASGKGAVILCCASEQYFADRVYRCGARPLLMTRQLMYPGAFLLKQAVDGWLRNETAAQIRERAAKAYAANQRIGVRAARGVFSDL